MPKVWEDRVKALRESGVKKDIAYATATKQLQNEGVLKKGTLELTKKAYNKVKGGN